MNLLGFSQVLIFLFVGSVTLWYCITPYLVKPHPAIARDIVSKTSLKESVSRGSSPLPNSILVENWTKWNLFANSSQFDGDNQKLIPGGSKSSLVFNDKTVMNMDWRSNYLIHIERDHKMVKVHRTAPFNADFGIYNHFEAKTSDLDNSVVQVIPRYLFGIPFDTIEQLYGSDVSKFPIVGVFTDSVRFDRIVIQIYMNIVTLSVVFLLYANNPPDSLLKAKKA